MPLGLQQPRQARGLPVGTDDSSRVTASTRVIAIDAPNDNGISTI